MVSGSVHDFVFGMMLGNSSTNVSLALERFLINLRTQRRQVKDFLAMGRHSGRPLAGHWWRQFVRTWYFTQQQGHDGRGQHAGQMLSGAQPGTAVRHQTLLTFILAAASALGSLTGILVVYQHVFDARDRLRAERLSLPGQR